MAGRIIETNFTPEDSKVEETLRPQLLDDYIGQQKAKENMKVFIEAAKQRGDSLDHVLFVRTARAWQDNACRDHCQ